MPFYDYKCECGHEWQEFKKIANMLDPISLPCPSCNECGKVTKPFSGIPGFGDPTRLGLKKPDSGFKDLMQRIHERTPGSNLDKSSTITKL
jgi:hypothetical protein